MSVQTIVVAEDDGAIRDLVTHHLEREGFSVLKAGDGPAALRAARMAVDLLVLDVGLPGIDGYDVARTLRREQRTLPIVMLTARTDEVDRVVGFEVGADDYVCKPFSPRELTSRVKAILRRRDAALAPLERRAMRFGPLEVDERSREVRVDGNDIGLKPREFALMVELAKNAGIAMTRERLLERVWGYDYSGDDRTVDVHVYRLRHRLSKPWNLAHVVRTIAGYGYKFVAP